MRKLILTLLIAGMLGLGAELLLLDHTAVLWQWVPLGALGIGLVAAVVVAVRPSRATLRPFRAVMALLVLIGAVGIGLHVQGNLEFERELDPSATGVDRFRNALGGAFPALAPAALSQLGLLGLIYAWKHPALEPTGARDTPSTSTRTRP